MPGPGLGADDRHVLGGLVEGQRGEERWPRRVVACRLGVPGGLHCPEERTASHVLEGTRGLLSWGARAICAPDKGGGGGVQHGACTAGDSECAGHRQLNPVRASAGPHPEALAGVRVGADHGVLSGDGRIRCGFQ